MVLPVVYFCAQTETANTELIAMIMMKMKMMIIIICNIMIILKMMITCFPFVMFPAPSTVNSCLQQ